MASISISFADVNIPIKGKRVIYNWIRTVILSEKKKPGGISIILCSDEFLLDMNKRFLKHNYYTDIITFDYTEGDTISGELYISVDRVKENAVRYKGAFANELYRVIIHGVLHLCGYHDKSPQDRERMRKKEDQKLKLLEH